jgi:nucleoside-diphosphate-sugar epimerase
MQNLSKPLVIVTGSTGFIGSRTIEALVPDHTVVGLDVKEPEELISGSIFIECDLTRDESVRAALDSIKDEYGDRIASVIHLAAYYDFSGSESEMYRRLTVEGTARLLRKLQEFQTEQFAFSSTVLVLEPAEETDEELTERSPLEDEPWAYPQSKIEAEETIKRERGEIPTVTLRIAGVYDDECHSLPIAQQISRIYERQIESHFFPGDDSHGQPFVHAEDLAGCLRKVVDRRHQLKNELFLIAEPELMSFEEMQNQLGELIHGEEWTTVWIPKIVAKAGAWIKEKIENEEDTFIKPWMVDLADAHYPVAIDHAREHLGWEPQHRLRDTLPLMIGDLKQDPRAWYEKNSLVFPDEMKVSKKAS